jgi:sulfhydrogenase subunit beta (sulfur reductase)
MMEQETIHTGETVLIERTDFQQLLDALHSRGYEVIGPTLQSDTIVYGPISTLSDLPVGWTDRQEAGAYRLARRQDDALFGYVVGPHSWKRYLYPPVVRLWQAQRQGQGFQFVEEAHDAPRYAFLGVRPCELQAIAIQDQIFLKSAYADPIYQERRQDLFIVAVNCTEPGGACFCASMQTGPEASAGFDLALTEVITAESATAPGQHYFVTQVGSERGAEVLADVRVRPVSPAELEAARALLAAAASHMGRELDIQGVRDLLYRNLEHPRWAEIANRCLTCGNCTLVCPTCFCTSVEDVTDLSGERAERWRKWDSCFTLDFSYMHGGSLRASPEARYRQWLTHKLAGWLDQFGVLGCVGCGRCITWCPARIDITAEVQAIRRTDRSEVAPETTAA